MNYEFNIPGLIHRSKTTDIDRDPRSSSRLHSALGVQKFSSTPPCVGNGRDKRIQVAQHQVIR